VVSPTQAMRKAWAAYECQRDKMQRISFGPDSILVAPETVDAWRALESVLAEFEYDIRIEDTDSYNCRPIKSGGARSLHSYGIALDVNWQTNPYIDHPDERDPRFSSGSTQAARAQDVKLGRADTDMTRAMVDAVLAIQTQGGRRVFGWGGDWRTLKDGMHFQIEVTPTQLNEGIDWSTVAGPGNSNDAPDDDVPGPSETEESSMGLPAIFFDTVRKPLFGGGLNQSAVDNMNLIVGFWLENYPNNPLNQLAYVLATVRAEVGSNMRPVREAFAKTDAEARSKLAGRAYAKSAGPFGHAYYGRGYVQLTHLSNYRTQGEKLGIDLVQFPDRALETEVALQILVNGMMGGDFNGQGHGLAHYVNATRQDFVGARRTVNVQDRAAEIAGFAEKFLQALKLAAAAQGGSLSLPGSSGASIGGSGPIVQPEIITDSDDRLNDLLAQLSQLIGGLDGNGNSGVDLRTLLPLLLLLLGKSGKFDSSQLQTLVGTDVEIPDKEKALTNVNNALGQTVGKVLDGKKTGLGILGTLAAFLLGGTSGDPTLNVTNAGSVLGPLLGAVGGASPVILPITIALMGWGLLGKIDKWVKNPK